MALLGFPNGQEVFRFLSELQIKVCVCVCVRCVSLRVFVLAAVNCGKLSKVGWGGVGGALGLALQVRRRLLTKERREALLDTRDKVQRKEMEHWVP